MLTCLLDGGDSGALGLLQLGVDTDLVFGVGRQVVEAVSGYTTTQ